MKTIHHMTGFLLFILIIVGTLAALSEVVRGDSSTWDIWLDQFRGKRIEVLLGCLLALFLTVLYALSGINFKERVQYLAYDIEGGGSVSISLQAMQDFIARLADEFSQVVSLQPALKAVNGAVDVQLDVKVKAGTQIPELCRMLQDRTRECIKQNVGISDVREIRVRVQEIVVDKTTAAAASPEKQIGMNWDAVAEEYLRVAEEVFGPLRERVEALAAEVATALRNGNKVIFCGNGGSAADAQHLAGEFVNRFLFERKPYAGIALSTDTSVLTSIGNDYGFEQVFEKQVQALGKKGDILVGISTSGNAANVIRAFSAARKIGITTVALTGGTGGAIVEHADRVLAISCTKSTPRIQEGHLIIMHTLCQRIEELMEGK